MEASTAIGEVTYFLTSFRILKQILINVEHYKNSDSGFRVQYSDKSCNQTSDFMVFLIFAWKLENIFN